MQLSFFEQNFQNNYKSEKFIYTTTTVFVLKFKMWLNLSQEMGENNYILPVINVKLIAR